MSIPNANMPGMRNGTRKVPTELAFKIAITLELDPASVIADLEEQREKNPKRRDFWRGFLSRATTVLAVIVCTLALSFSATYGTGAGRLGGDFFRRPNRA